MSEILETVEQVGRYRTNKRRDKPVGLLSSHHTRRLDTMRAVLSEQARVYRATINGLLSTADGARLSYQLKEIRATQESIANVEAAEAEVQAASIAATPPAPLVVNVVSIPSGHFEQQDGSFAPNIPEHLQIEHAPQQLSAPEPVEGITQSSEEEARIINDLKSEINQLARKMGVSLVV